MSAFVETEITAEAITTAMNEDANFTVEVWTELAAKLDMGLLKDNACDVLCGTPNVALTVAEQFEAFATALRRGIEMRGADLVGTE